MQLFFNISTGAKQRKTFLQRHRKTERRPLGTCSEVLRQYVCCMNRYKCLAACSDSCIAE